jgi:SAM-dependent methyltransferase
MEDFCLRYLRTREDESLLICDLGSQDVNGSYRPLFCCPSWRYLGIDMANGPNVDLVLRTPYHWKEVASGSVDVLISGQALEHIEYFWITMLEVERVLKPGGLCCILAPSSGPEHRYPVDCWRFYPDGMRTLSRFSCLVPLEVRTQWEDEGHQDGSDWWHDSMLICTKPVASRWSALRRSLIRWLQHRTMLQGV